MRVRVVPTPRGWEVRVGRETFGPYDFLEAVKEARKLARVRGELP